MTKFWLGVVQRSHVLRGVAGGFAQTNHGVKTGIQRMSPGDGLVYYSPKTDYLEGDALREFTAIGRVTHREPWQEDEGEWKPWRREIAWDAAATAAPIAPLLDVLELTRGNSNWGFIMRRGQVEVTENDFRAIAREMQSGEFGSRP